MTTIAPLVSRDLLTISPHDTVATAARLMNQHKVGAAVVMTEQGPWIITERDILRAVAEGANPNTGVVEDFLTASAVTVTAQWQIEDAAREMMRRRFRHLIVVDERGTVEGIISIRDIAGALVKELEALHVHA
jgi:CBS domain-containing protein